MHRTHAKLYSLYEFTSLLPIDSRVFIRNVVDSGANQKSEDKKQVLIVD